MGAVVDHTLLLGDFFDLADRIEDDSVELVFADQPLEVRPHYSDPSATQERLALHADAGGG